MFSARRFLVSRRCHCAPFMTSYVTQRLITTNNCNRDKYNKNLNHENNNNSNMKVNEKLELTDIINENEISNTVLNVLPTHITNAQVDEANLDKVTNTLPFSLETSSSSSTSTTNRDDHNNIRSTSTIPEESLSTTQHPQENVSKGRTEQTLHSDNTSTEKVTSNNIVNNDKEHQHYQTHYKEVNNANTETVDESAKVNSSATTSKAKANAEDDTSSESGTDANPDNNENGDTKRVEVHLLPPPGFKRFFSKRLMSYLPMPLRPRQAIERALITPNDEKELIYRIYYKRVGKIRRRRLICLLLTLMAYLGYRQAQIIKLNNNDLGDYHHVEVNLQHNSAVYYDEHHHKIAMRYFIDYDTFLTTCDPDKDVMVRFTTPYPWLPMLFLALMPVIAIVGSMIERQSISAVMHSASVASRFKFKRQLGVETRLNDVAGLVEAKREVVEVIDFLKQPTRYTDMGARLPKGVLLDGPPGVGKTLLAKAVAGEAMVPFVSCSGSEFEEVYVGVGAQRVRELFKEAHSCKPCVVFIDEVDTVGRKRQGSHGNSRSTLNALLAEMDGYKDSSGIIVLAATNRADTLDKAFTRSGRFDRKIKLELPSYKDRVEVAKVHLKPLKLAPIPVNNGSKKESYADTIAALTPGCSGADIFNICNEAAIIAARNNASCVALEHFHRAVERVLVGLERSAVRYLPHERERIAYHEAGVVVLNWFLKLTDPVLKTTILPRGRHRTGVTQRLPQNIFISTEERVKERVIGKLGGYVTEEFFFSDISTSAANDLQEATTLALRMVCEWGMQPREIGHLGYELDQENTIQKPFGPAKENVVDDAVEQIVHSSLERARDMIKEREHHVRLVASRLLQVETLTAHELRAILGDRPVMSKEFLAYLESERQDEQNKNVNENGNCSNDDNNKSKDEGEKISHAAVCA